MLVRRTNVKCVLCKLYTKKCNLYIANREEKREIYEKCTKKQFCIEIAWMNQKE